MMRTPITSLSMRLPSRRPATAFTLLEMLIVLAIIALLAGLSLPAIRGNLESRAINAAGNQFLSDLALARQKAISQRGTVAIVFLTDTINGLSSLNPDEQKEIDRLRGGVYTHYALYGFRRAGEQPGRGSIGYLSEWRVLPEKTFFSTNFVGVDLPRTSNATNVLFETVSLTDFPFPFSASANRVVLPYVAFNDEGRMIKKMDSVTGRGAWMTDATNFIAIARGAVFYARSPDGKLAGPIELQEIPPYNSTNNLFVIDPFTGRAEWVRTEL